MFKSPSPHDLQQLSKPKLYEETHSALQALLSGERDFIANLANTAALLWEYLPDINWAGFYLLKNDELVLGPFHGKPACVRIAIGKGVCGTAAQQRKTIVVPNVHEFEGHIACDSASNAEIVVPLIKSNALIGVLDIDSPMLNRFDGDDRVALERVAALLLTASDV